MGFFILKKSVTIENSEKKYNVRLRFENVNKHKKQNFFNFYAPSEKLQSRGRKPDCTFSPQFAYFSNRFVYFDS